MLASDPADEIKDGTIGKRTFLAAMTASGVSTRDAFRIIKSFNGVRKFDRCGAKDAFSFARERSGHKLVAFEYATSPLDIWQARLGDDGELVGKKLQLEVEEKHDLVAIPIGDDLRTSIVQAGLDDDLLGMLDEALEGHAELSDLHPGARLRIVATESRVEGVFARFTSLDAVEYFPASPAAGSPPSIRVYKFPYGQADSAPGGSNAKKVSAGYYDAKGKQPFRGGWRSPVPLARVSSRFNPHRMHPVLHIIKPHNGVDFAAPVGTPIYAAASGTVKVAGDGGPCGNMVQIEHPNGLVTAYCHMSRFAPGLHAGDHVEGRQLIGYVGQTGRATGPHLHFALKRGNVFLDPLNLKMDGVRVVPADQRDAFDQARGVLDGELDGIPLPSAPPGASAVAGADGGSPDQGTPTESESFDEAN